MFFIHLSLGMNYSFKTSQLSDRRVVNRSGQQLINVRISDNLKWSFRDANLGYTVMSICRSSAIKTNVR